MRITIFLWIVSLMLLSTVIMLSPTVPNNVGAVSYTSVDRFGIHYHFFDPFTGIHLMRTTPFNQAIIPQLDIELSDGRQVLQLIYPNDAPQTIASYPLQPRYQWQLWQDIGQTVLLIHVDYNPTQTILSQVDVVSGDITPYMTLPDFEINSLSISPDGNYLLLRENPYDTLVAVAPEAHRLIALETGQVMALDEILYAHWSPDSQFLLLGQLAPQPQQATVEILTLATGDRQQFDLTIAQQQLSIFLDNPLNTATSVLWSPDSQTLAIYEDHANQLHHISRDGVTLHRYDVGRLLPEQWSPDGRYLITTGYDDDRVGAFIIDTQTHNRYQIQSDAVINSGLVDFAWSPDSQYIAMFVRSTGIRQGVNFELYDRYGQARSVPELPQSNENYFIYRDSLYWLTAR